MHICVSSTGTAICLYSEHTTLLGLSDWTTGWLELENISVELFNLKKNAFNLKHDITIKNYDVELYVEDSGEPHYSAGVYSVLENEWITVPEREKAKIDLNKVKEKSNQWMEIIDGVIDAAENEEIEDVKDLFKKYGEKLKKYRTGGLKKGGEYSYENLVFKVLRRNGYIEKFREAEDKIIDKQLSLKENRIF